MNRFHLGLAALMTLSAPVIASAPSISTPPATRILDNTAAQRLRANKGVTLQWIDWDHRGSAQVSVAKGVWTLRAAQAEAGGPGRITEIGGDYFLFDGVVRITDSPDHGRSCEKHDTWRFAVTRNRHYWRIRTFEWCDGLTDYIDIYF